MNKTDSSFEVSRLVVEVWDWDRYTANDLVGGFSIPVPEIVEWSTGGSTVTNWYRLLDAKNLKQKYEHVIEDSEAEKVRDREQKNSGSILYHTHTHTHMHIHVMSCLQLIEEFKKKTRIDRARGLRPEGIPDLRRGSEMVPESHGLPKMALGDFKLIVVLGKGSFGKVSLKTEAVSFHKLSN